MSKKSRFAPKLHIKKGDKVIVVAGASKENTVREVLEVFPSENRAIVADVNMVKKHLKATNDNPGGITETPAPIHVSNLMLVDPESGEPTRIGRREEDGKLVRYSKKSGKTIK